MFAARFALALVVLASSKEVDGYQSSTAPSYSPASIVSSASNLPNDYAPNSIVSIYGANLAFDTRSSPAASTVPSNLAGVTVYIGNSPASIFYVSPTQVNVLVPNNLLPGPTPIWISRQGIIGPITNIVLAETAPEVFQSSPGTALATHADGSLITQAAPCLPSEVIVIYAVGLGRTNPDFFGGQVPKGVAPLQHFTDLQVLLNGTPVDPTTIFYAGATPGFAGLYQINVQLPAGMPPSPELRVGMGSQVSAPGLTLPTP